MSEEDTLRASGGRQSTSRTYSTSPSRLVDGSDLLQDLHEMSGYANRIDLLLDEQQASRSVSPIRFGQVMEGDEEEEEGEVD